MITSVARLHAPATNPGLTNQKRKSQALFASQWPAYREVLNPCRPRGYCESKPCAVARVMWEADEAWRSKLRRSVRLSDLIDTLSEEIPADLWQSSFEWARKRAG
jgi:hypothetical protein